MVGDLFSAFVLTRAISELKIPGQRPFSAFVLTRTISEGPLPPGGGLSSVPDRFPQRFWYQDPGTKILVPRSLGEPVWYAGETPPGGRGPSEIVLVRTISEKGR